MSKKYQFSFTFHETKNHISLDYASYKEALDDAQFYSKVFIEAAWNNVAPQKSFENTLNEFVKLVGDFKLAPNETNFNFNDYFEDYYRLYDFRKELEGTWRGMIL